MPLVSVIGLAKSYRSIAALANLSLQVESGEILGLLGPNGAGKTTLLRLLMGFLRPTSGHATIGDFDCYRQSIAVRRQTSYLPGDARLFRHLNGRQTLQFFSQLREHASFEKGLSIAERLGLDLDRKVRQMSTGMRQKLALAVTLMPETPLVILDEPTANLDPTVRREVIELIREARQQGRTIIFSSHVLSEIEDVCDRVVLLRSGQLVDNVRIADVLQQHRIRAALTGSLSPPPPDLAGSLAIAQREGQAEILTSGDLAPLLGWLAGQPVARLQIEPIGLRAIYEQHHPPSPA